MLNEKGAGADKQAHGGLEPFLQELSGLEMTQNSMRLSWDRERMEKELAEIMETIHEQCVSEGDEGDWVDYVRGANLAAFKRVAQAMLSLGIH